MAVTLRKKRKDRWLVRRDDIDYGPYTTEQVLDAIARRELDLGTPICNVAARHWDPLGTYAMFRDHYAECQGRWEVEEAHEEADRHERQLKAANAVKGGTWRLLLVGAILLVGLGGWLVYRFLHVQPSGVFDSVALAEPPALPEPPAPSMGWEALPEAEVAQVAPLRERINYDTAGVRVAGAGGSGPVVTSLDFEADGGAEISEADLRRITGSARRRLVGCAQEAAQRSEGFRGTEVGFTVRPKGLTSFTVGPEVAQNAPFKACVKRSLRGIRVPDYGGSERRVTIPLKVRR